MICSSFFRRVFLLLSIPRGNPQLLVAQYEAFRRQMPLMYLMLIANTWALAITHLATAPRWLVLHTPIALTAISALRVGQWMRMERGTPSFETAEKALLRTNRLAALIAGAFTAWALSLAPYGDAYAQAHVAFYMAITVIGVIFSLMHLRPAAITVAVMVNGAFFIYFLSSGNAVFRAVALNTALVSGVMLVILLNHYRDFTRLVDARADNERLANLDSLTGLPNRRSFFAELDARYNVAVARKTALAVGVVDLDGFKPINDVHGHAIGDKVLSQIGRRLSRLCAPHVQLARLGGDEFGLLISSVASEQELLGVGERVCRTLREPLMAGDIAVRLSGSVGFAVYPTQSITAAQLYEFADYALYAAKRNKRGSVVIFSDHHDAAIRRVSLIEQALQMAEFEAELTLMYQPIVDVATGRVVAFEALARWSNSELGIVPPDQFIPVAERIGIVSTLTRVLLKQALSAALTWPDRIRLAFNLSTLDLGSREAVSELIHLVASSGLDPARLDLEVTETAVARDFNHVREAASTLRSLGCGVSLDDFGVGYSSLSYLHTLPLTKIKIDRSFVRRIDVDRTSHKIVRSLLALGRDMGVRTIVEGVETQAELEALISAGCELAQGFLFSKPVAPAETAELIDRCLSPRLHAGEPV